MLRCDKCGRDGFKSKGGLTMHKKNCKVEVVEEETLEEVITEEVVEDEVVSTEKQEFNDNPERGIIQEKVLSDNIKRKLKKLRDARKSTWDAVSRNNIDLKIKELEG